MKKLSFKFKKQKKSVKIKGSSCLNCNQKLDESTNFCPNCGQKNDQRRISVSNYIDEYFSGFLSFDNRLTRTIVPLLFKPGKVTKEYIEGKRTYYANPFRLYLNISIIYFLIISLFSIIDDFQSKKRLDQEEEVGLQQLDSLLTASDDRQTIKLSDSIKKVTNSIKSAAAQKEPETIAEVDIGKNKIFDKIEDFMTYDKTHENTETEVALKDLGYKNTLWNRFVYTRSQNLNRFVKDKNYREVFTDNLISRISIALFILLPLFTLFVWLFYLRKPHNYSEHMVFVFQAQSVLFILLIIQILLERIFNLDITFIILLIFLFYLYKAMRNFYRQNRFVTTIKLIVLNLIYFIIALTGGIALTILTFIL